MALTQGQTDAINMVKQFIISPSVNEMVLSGAAGTGKSFVVKEILKNIEDMYAIGDMLHGHTTRYEIALLATTNKAAAALESQMGQEVKTIHSYFGLIPVYNHETHKYVLARRKDPNGKVKTFTDTLFLIDEYSFIDETLYKLIHSAQYNCKFIYIGDHCQLPPIDSELPYVHTLNIPLQTHLTEIVRQDSTSILRQLSYDMRNSIDKNLPLPPFIADNKNIFYVDEGTFQNQLILDITNGVSTVFLAHTNGRVKQYNEGLKKLFSKENRPYAEGDLVIANAPIINPLTHTVLVKNEAAVFIEQVVKGHESTLTESGNIHTSGYHIKIEGHMYFMPEDPLEKERMLKIVECTEERENILIKWINVRHGYACTVHKSQGSTFKHVYVDLNDLAITRKYSEEIYKRLLYVACSRSSDKLILIGHPW